MHKGRRAELHVHEGAVDLMQLVVRKPLSHECVVAPALAGRKAAIRVLR